MQSTFSWAFNVSPYMVDIVAIGNT